MDDDDNSMNLSNLNDRNLQDAEAAMRFLDSSLDEARAAFKEPEKYTKEQIIEAFAEPMRFLEFFVKGGQMLVEMEQVTRGEV